jgi:hypothetical protein
MKRDAPGCVSSRRRLLWLSGCPSGWKLGGRTRTNHWNSPSSSGEGKAGLRPAGEADSRRESPGAPPVGPDPSRPQFFGWAPRTLSLFAAANASGLSAPAFCSHAQAVVLGNHDVASATTLSARVAAGRLPALRTSGYAGPAPTLGRRRVWATRGAIIGPLQSAGNGVSTACGSALRTPMCDGSESKWTRALWKRTS